MNRQDELMYISKHPSDYLHGQSRGLEQRLENVKINEEEARQIIANGTTKIITDRALSFMGPIGGVISGVLEWNETINNDMDEAKKAYLLNQYFDKTDDLSDSLNAFRNLLLSPQGNTLFNKILRLLDDSPPDQELADHLSTVLRNIVVKGSFEKLFEKHRYALGQIERLTPQALTIIADYTAWPPIKLGTSMSFGAKITSDFYTEFAHAYCSQKQIIDDAIFTRVQHSVIELQNLGLMEAYKAEDGRTRCKLTYVGEDLLWYITLS